MSPDDVARRGGASSDTSARVPTALLRELAPRVVARLTRRFRDFAAVEDAVQEALVAAVRQWPERGVPDHPEAWLARVAARRLTDHVRADAARRHREALVVSLVPLEDQIALAPDEGPGPERDDTLDLLFACCHPALSHASQLALTLRAVGGLTTAEIARAFLVPEATMAQRISRAKESIRAAGASFALPSPAELAARVPAVLHVLYLVFNEGYAASEGAELVRVDLCREAIRLVRMLARVMPAPGVVSPSAAVAAEVHGLLALTLLTDARRPARTGPAGELVPLDRQDRALWDRAAIDEGLALVAATLPRGAVGPFQLQAAIAALHDEAPSWDTTDWPQIVALYELLMRMDASPMVALSHAVALAMVHGPALGLARLDALAADARLARHHRLAAARAHLFERAGDLPAARDAYRLAADRTTSLAERDYLLARAAALDAPSTSRPGA